MSITSFTKPKGAVTILIALILIADANLILPLLGVELTPGGIMIARILGGAYLGSGIGIWMISGPKDISATSAYLYALGELVATVAVLLAVLGDYMNIFGYALVASYAYYCVAFFGVARSLQRSTSYSPS